MEKAKITYRGWAGHFICAQYCRFRLNTLIEFGDVKVVVSSVGLMENPMLKIKGHERDEPFTTIGYERHFETMAFHAEYKNGFWDANISRGVNFSGDWAFSEIDSELAANDNHSRIVAEIANRLESGETLEDRQY